MRRDRKAPLFIGEFSMFTPDFCFSDTNQSTIVSIVSAISHRLGHLLELDIAAQIR
jgi:hypothetical protein